MPDTRLRVTEIFHSLQGESRYSGLPTVFIRLTGCPLRCGYCDTEYAFSGGSWMEFSTILETVAGFNTSHACVTGGEPLAQPGCKELLFQLCELGYSVSLETSGAMNICGIDLRVSRVMDIKTPGSGEMEKNLWSNIELLTPHDQVKFVICSRDDYEWAAIKLKELELADKCEVLFSPSYTDIQSSDLAEWILKDRLPVRMQIQLHKLLWGDQPGV